MSAFYSNQPTTKHLAQTPPTSDDSKLFCPDQDLLRSPKGTGLDVPPHRIVDEETMMTFPDTDESGEPIRLNAPPNEDDPTPEEIERRSEVIRARWSDRVKKKRHLRAPVRWNVPSVPVADIDFQG